MGRTLIAKRMRRLMLRSGRGDAEAGEATIEFIGLFVILVIPAVYFVVALGMVQAGVFATEAGAREAARILAEEPTDSAAAHSQVVLAFSDFGIDSAPVMETGCSVCSGPGRDVSVTVRTSVRLPLVPAWLGAAGQLPVSSTEVALVEEVGIDEP